jgi:segregation and condensation protein A
MKEKEIIDMIVKGYPWEQVIYNIVAVEALDPWDMDICALSSSLLKYLAKLKEMDFKIPAKYIIIAAVLLKMKSDHLHFIEFLHEHEAENLDSFDEEMDMVELEQIEEDEDFKPNLDFLSDSFNLREKRIHKRKIMFEELIVALRKALKTEKRRERRKARAIIPIQIEREDISKRIADLYKRIDSLLVKIKKEEIEFSKLVDKWKRDEILRTFLPLIYLDSEKKVNCRQEKMFDEIFIKRVH